MGRGEGQALPTALLERSTNQPTNQPTRGWILTPPKRGREKGGVKGGGSSRLRSIAAVDGACKDGRHEGGAEEGNEDDVENHEEPLVVGVGRNLLRGGEENSKHVTLLAPLESPLLDPPPECRRWLVDLFHRRALDVVCSLGLVYSSSLISLPCHHAPSSNVWPAGGKRHHAPGLQLLVVIVEHSIAADVRRRRGNHSLLPRDRVSTQHPGKKSQPHGSLRVRRGTVW